jgi:hypothetical protein
LLLLSLLLLLVVVVVVVLLLVVVSAGAQRSSMTWPLRLRGGRMILGERRGQGGVGQGWADEWAAVRVHTRLLQGSVAAIAVGANVGTPFEVYLHPLMYSALARASHSYLDQP